MRGHLYWSVSVVLLLWICQFGKCWQTYRDHVCLKTNPNSSDYDCYDYGEADFGEVSRHGNNIMGVVILASPSNACSVVTPKSEQNITVSGNLFLLINDGGCAYDFKALKATKGGYDAAIIRNMQSDDLVFLKGGKYESEVSIPAIYVGKDTGELLELNNVIRNPGASVIITPQGPSELWDIEYYMIPFAIIVGICFILMAMFMISRYYRHYLEQRRNRLSPTNLRKIPTKKYKKGDDYYDLCAICLEEYKDGERLRILPCEHAYHCKCVDPWLTEGKRTCPVCKQPVENDKRPRNRRQRVDPEAGESTNDADETTPLISSSSSSPPNSHTVVA